MTIAVGALLLAPHGVWLVTHDFLPITYALDARSAKTFGQTMANAASYLAGGIGYVAAPVILVLALTRPSGAALADTLLPRTPERRFVAVAFLATLVILAVFAPVFKYDLNPIWTMSDFVLLPVVLLSSPAIALSRRAVVSIVAFAVALPPIMLAAAPAIALAAHLRGVDPPLAHAELLARQVEQLWRRTTDRPLRIVGGDFGIANMTAFYLPGQPSPFPVLEPETAPWVTRTHRARRCRDGVQPVPLPARLHYRHKTGDGRSDRSQSTAAPRRGHNHAQLFGYSGQARTLFDHRRAAAAVSFRAAERPAPI